MNADSVGEGKGEVLHTREIIHRFPPEPATQHQVDVRMRYDGEVRLRHSIYVSVDMYVIFLHSGSCNSNQLVILETGAGFRKRSHPVSETRRSRLLVNPSEKLRPNRHNVSVRILNLIEPI